MTDLTLDDALRRLEEAGAIRSRWLPGMQAVFRDGGTERYEDGDGRWAYGDRALDTTDPLTVQGLLLLAREAFDGPAWVAPTGERQWDSEGATLLPVWGCYAGGLTEPLTAGTCRRAVVEAALIAAAERLP